MSYVGGFFKQLLGLPFVSGAIIEKIKKED